MSADTIKASFTGTVLALDTSTSAASAALSSRGSIVASVNFETTAQVSKTLFSTLQSLFDTADLAPEDVDRFAAVTGPGSFTGLRVGLSAIESMARTLKRPSVGVTAFDAVAVSLGIAGRIIVLLEAGKGELFFGVRIVDPQGRVESSGNDGSAPLDAVIDFVIKSLMDQPAVITGSGALKYSEVILAATDSAAVNPMTIGSSLVASASFLAESVARLAASREVSSEQGRLRAYYIKPSDAEIKAAKSGISSETTEIAEMGRSEIEAVIALETSCGLSSRGAAGFERALADPAAVILLARSTAVAGAKGDVVGVVSGIVVEDELQVDNVVVDARFRNRGIAQRLLRRALEVASGKGAQTAILEVREGNREARRLYEKLGFKTVGRRKDYYVNPKDDALTMMFEMNESSTGQ